MGASSRQNESLDLKLIEVLEDPKVLTNSSPLKTVKDLPFFTTLSAPILDGGTLMEQPSPSKLTKCMCEETVPWKRNLFEIPRGRVGTEFV